MLLDTNILLELELNQEKAQDCADLLEAIKEGKINAYITDFTLDSILLIMERYQKKSTDLRRFLLSLHLLKSLSIYNLSFLDKINATYLMEKYSLDMDDAFIAQALISNNDPLLISFDSDFDNMKTITRKEPAEILKELENKTKKDNQKE